MRDLNRNNSRLLVLVVIVGGILGYMIGRRLKCGFYIALPYME